jgi:hypothetical protein
VALQASGDAIGRSLFAIDSIADYARFNWARSSFFFKNTPKGAVFQTTLRLQRITEYSPNFTDHHARSTLAIHAAARVAHGPNS